MKNNAMKIDINVSILVGGYGYKKPVYNEDIEIKCIKDVHRAMHKCAEWVK